MLTANAANGRLACYVGVEIVATADLSRARDFEQLDERGRLGKVARWNAAYLTSLWSLDPHVALDVRYVSQPAERRVRCYVVARVTGAPEVAPAMAEVVRRRLTAVPRHLFAVPIDDDVVATLLPGVAPPDPRAVAGIRKRVVTMQANRPDAHHEGFPQYLAVLPFADVPQGWEYLHQRLCEDSAPPMVLSISLASRRTTPGFMDFCGRAATLFAKYGSQLDDSKPGALYQGNQTLVGEPFAEDASQTFARARRRYSDRVFQLRVTLAADQPLPSGLVEMVGQTISPTDTDHEASTLEASAGPLYEIVEATADTWPLHGDHLTRLSFPEQLTGHPLFAAWPTHGPWGTSVTDLRFLAAVVDAREAAAVATLPTAPYGFLPGFPVELPGLPTRVFRRNAGPAVTLGRQVVAGREVDDEVTVPVGSLTAHTLVAGTTGSGKTSSVLSLLHQLWCPNDGRPRVPFLVIEPVNAERDDYRWLLDQPGFEDMAVFTLGDEACAPFRLNPFEVPVGVHVRTHVANLLHCFDAAFGLWDPLPQIYQRALNETYLAQGFSLSAVAQPNDADRWPRLTDFVAAMQRETEDLDYAGEVQSNIVAASRVRVESLVYGPCAESLDVRRSFPIDRLLARPAVIELGRLGGNLKEQALVIALILNAMTEHYMASRTSSELAHVTVLEEAHRLLPAGAGAAAGASGPDRQGDSQSQAAAAFAATLAENRKYGEALVLVEQIPSKLISDAVKNTSLKVMHRLPGGDDRRVLGDSMDFRPDHQDVAGTLQTFECLVKHPGIEAPAVARAPNIRAVSGSSGTAGERPLPGHDEVRRRHAEIVSREPEMAAALGPFAGCHGCRHRCDHRAYAHSVAHGRRAQEGFGDVWTRGLAIADEQALPPGTRWDTAPYDHWWPELRSFVAGLDGPRPNGADVEARGDFDACVILHLWWARWGNEPPERFMHYFRDHLVED